VTVVERWSQEEAEKEYEKTLRRLAAERPTADAKWSRVKIVRIDSQGNEQEALLEGDWFIFDARDAKEEWR